MIWMGVSAKAVTILSSGGMSIKAVTYVAGLAFIDTVSNAGSSYLSCAEATVATAPSNTTVRFTASSPPRSHCMVARVPPKPRSSDRYFESGAVFPAAVRADTDDLQHPKHLHGCKLFFQSL